MKRITAQLTIIGLFCATLGLVFAMPTLARESHFTPAIHEIDSSSEFKERAVVTSDGGLSLYTYNGDLLDGFPVFATSRVFVSSPVFADLDSSGVAEVVVVSRNSSNAYAVHAYDGSGGELEQVSIAGEVYYDPTVIGNKVYVANTAGKVFEVSYSGSLSATEVLDLGVPVGLTQTVNSGLIINYPESSKLEIYEKNGATWQLSKTISTAQSIIYPVAVDQNIAYGVTSNKITKINLDSGQVISPFPKVLSETPVGPPVLANIDEGDDEYEIVVNLQNGDRAVFKQNGNQLSDSLSSKSFTDTSLDTAEIEEVGVFTSIGNYALGLIRDARDSIVSIFSNNRLDNPTATSVEPPVLPPGAVVYEDGEDGDTAGWSVYDDDPTGATIKNIYLDETYGRVIKTDGYYTGNGYRLQNSDGTDWNNREHKNIHWEMNMQGASRVYVKVQTNQGALLIAYTEEDVAQNPDSLTVFVTIGRELGVWRVIERNLQADLDAIRPGLIITDVDQFLIRGSGMINNVALFTAEEIVNISGTVVDDKTGFVEGAVVDLYPLNLSTTTDSNGYYEFVDLPSSIYELEVSKTGMIFENATQNVDAVGGSAIRDFSGSTSISTTVYEDAENGDILGWEIYDNTPPMTIDNVVLDEVRGRVIHLDGAGFQNSVNFRGDFGALNNKSEFVLHWDMMMDDGWSNTVAIWTNNGWRRIVYHFSDVEQTSPNIYYIKLGRQDGQWRSITRNLQDDMEMLEPGTIVTNVVFMGFRGSGYVDNIYLMNAEVE